MFKSIAMIVAGLSTTATVAFAAAETAGPVQAPASAYELSESERAVFVDYLVCSETAAIRIMSESEAAPCILLYTEVKLTFVPEVDLITFLQMPPMERHVGEHGRLCRIRRMARGQRRAVRGAFGRGPRTDRGTGQLNLPHPNDVRAVFDRGCLNRLFSSTRTRRRTEHPAGARVQLHASLHALDCLRADHAVVHAAVQPGRRQNALQRACGLHSASRR
jgi:hypothetical protein